MKKLVSFIIFVLCLSLATIVSAGGGHRGGGYSGGRGGSHGHGGYYGGGGYRGGRYYGGYSRGYGHGGGYYGGHHGGYYDGYSSWAVGVGFGGYPYYGYGAPYYGYGYAPVYYAPAPVYYAPAYYAPSGHWETQQIWVPGSQRSWVDQYYDKSRDVWVLGHWEERPGGPGYWTQQQVWVAQ